MDTVRKSPVDKLLGNTSEPAKVPDSTMTSHAHAYGPVGNNSHGALTRCGVLIGPRTVVVTDRRLVTCDDCIFPMAQDKTLDKQYEPAEFKLLVASSTVVTPLTFRYRRDADTAFASASNGGYHVTKLYRDLEAKG